MENNFDTWLETGYKNGWVGPSICYTHDGLPTSEQEDTEFEESDPCIHILRLYEDADAKIAIEENHAPSMWRASNQGMGI